MSFTNEPVPEIESAVYLPSQDGCHALFAPLHYEPGYAYPLVVWLHGPGGTESQLRKIMPLVSMRNYVAVAPRGVTPVRDAPGYQWQQSHQDIQLAEQRVLECIDAASTRFNIAPQRIFLAGLECGGTMAFRVALQHPHLFAGVLSLCGSFPTGNAPMSRIADARRLPLFLACGRTAERFSTTMVCENLRLFHAAGMAVTLREYPCGDELTTQMLSDMDRWIMEQIFPSQPAAADQTAHGRG